MGESKTTVERRTFLTLASGAAATAMAAMAGFIGAGFLYPIERKKQPALFVALENEVPDNRPIEIKDLMGRKVLLMRRGEKEMAAIGTVCSHLGCTVYYRPGKNMFECPCHMGKFDADGNPVSGPPQRPLDHYPVIVRDGKVFVDFS